ncbi:MAG: glycosyltransferase family 1 protein [Spartobacteria bacterium]|nr:glycosyltransferase family 1 protein [Spartobacteria bacterium]
MKIAINISWMMPGQTGGMEWYVRNLIEQLAIVDTTNRYVLITGHMNHTTFAPPSERFEKVIYIGTQNQPEAYQYASGTAGRAQHRAILRQHRKNVAGAPHVYEDFATLIREEKPDLWFCPLIFAVPPDIDIPLVITIPDLQHEHFPHFFSPHDLAMRAMAYPYGSRAATAVIGISDFTAREVQDYYQPDPERVFAIPLALDDRERLSEAEAAQRAARVRERYNLPDVFLYYPANGWAHKNHETLIEALAVIRTSRPVDLVLTGSAFDLFSRIQPLLDRHALQEHVHHLGYVSREDVPGLMSAASALVFPSLFEGFGLPVLEAMALGTPVACSRIGSLPDVGGDTVSYFDPASARDIAEVVLALLEDPTRQKEQIIAARQRAAGFSYRRTAEQTLDVFTQIAQNTLRPPGRAAPVPLDWENALTHGACRFHFRCPEMEHIQFSISTPAPGTLAVTLNREPLLSTVLPKGRRQSFSLNPSSHPADHYYTFELNWQRAGRHWPWHAAPRLLQLVAVNQTGTPLPFIS